MVRLEKENLCARAWTMSAQDTGLNGRRLATSSYAASASAVHADRRLRRAPYYDIRSISRVPRADDLPRARLRERACAGARACMRAT